MTFESLRGKTFSDWLAGRAQRQGSAGDASRANQVHTVPGGRHSGRRHIRSRSGPHEYGPVFPVFWILDDPHRDMRT